jgi:murein L,D-transpeptidase YafK
MVGFVSYAGLLLRFLAALLLVAVLTPSRDLPGTSAAAFVSMMSSLRGETALVVWKSGYVVTLYKGSVPIKTYRAVFGKGYADGDKARRGDKRTPEGDFYVCSMNPSKRFHKFLGLSYPNLRHAEQGLREGVISMTEYSRIQQAIEERHQPPWDTGLGGAVGIHGRTGENLSAFSSRQNWTDGCIALANADVDELFSVLSLGTPVKILP